MIDVDHFKQFNDQYGHNGGDHALMNISKIIQRLIREQDVLCRYGGEEFLLILKQTDKTTALSRSEAIREAIEQHTFEVNRDQPERITVSIGVASYPQDETSYENLVKQADEALYRAKELGRNRVVNCSFPQP